MEPPSRILIMSASAGAGHIRAAQAIEQAVCAKGTCDVRHIDALEHTTKVFRRLYQKAYIDLVNHAPEALGLIYDHLDKPWKYERRRLAWDQLNTRPFVELIKRYDPDWAVCTHFLPAELLARQNRAAEATAVLQELRALEPENVEYLLGLAKLHKQLGQFADADAQLKAALRKEPENPQVLAALVQLLLDWRQQLPEAQRLAQRLVELQPSGPNYFLLFNVRMLSADEDGGRRALEEAIRRDPQNPNYARAAAALGTK